MVNLAAQRSRARGLLSDDGIARKAREAALQMLYQLDSSGAGCRSRRSRCTSSTCGRGRGRRRRSRASWCAAAPAALDEIDAMIREVSKNWRLERMSRVDRNILRLGAYELLHCPTCRGASRSTRRSSSPSASATREPGVRQRRARSHRQRAGQVEDARGRALRAAEPRELIGAQDRSAVLAILPRRAAHAWPLGPGGLSPVRPHFPLDRQR